MDAPFNFAALNNAAVAATQGEILALLNNDVEALAPNWLREMLSYACQAAVGVVGAKLLYPDQTVQHAGVYLGVGGIASHAGVGLAATAPGNLGRAQAVQELSAVTAACWVLRRAVYQELDGLDPNLAVSYNDVDFCLRLRARGYAVIWTPHAQLLHHESASRGNDSQPEHRLRALREYSYMQARWGATLQDDPYYSPNLSQQRLDTLAEPPRTPRPWYR
jgi:GT2 family glycosyltransferase